MSALLLALVLNVHAAASLTDALREIGAAYTRQTGVIVRFNFGASGLLARQLENGAPGDVLLTADETTMKPSLIVRATRRDLLGNQLAIVSNVRIGSARDLVKLKSIAIGEPRTVPAGMYAKEYLERLGLWSKLQPKLIPTENVRATLAAVEAGNADAGIVYRTDVTKKVPFVLLVSDGPRIVYPVAVLRESPNPDAAERFIDYLAASKRVFVKYGFVVR